VTANLATRIAGLLALAVAALVLARVGGPPLVGIFALLRVVPPLAGVVLTAGLNGACVYFLAGPERDNPRLRSTLLAMAVAGGLVGAVLWMLSAPLLSRLFFTGLAVNLVALAGLRVLSYTILSTARGSLQGTHDLGGANWVFLMEDLLSLPLFLALLAAGFSAPVSLVAGLLLSDLLICAFAWTRLARAGFFANWASPGLALMRRVASFGIRSELASMIQLLNLRLDVLMIGALAGPGPLGTYFVAHRYAELLRLPPVALTFVLQPRYSSLHPNQSRATARWLAPRAGLLTLALAVPLALCAFVIPLIYGDAFRLAVLPAQILLIGLAPEGVAAVSSAFLYGTGRPGLSSLAMGAGLAVTVGMDLLLIPPFGAVGAAVASCAAFLVTTLLLVIFFLVQTRPARLAPLPAAQNGVRSPLPMRRRPGISPRFSRRLLDLAVTVPALIALWPLLLAIAVGVRMSGPGPVIFRQTRVGQGGKTFKLLKFRSMRTDLPGPELTVDGDPRVTRIGRLIRAWSLDELPQLVNVLRGDMTLVGPRPETVQLAARYPARYRGVFQHRPGITGPVQVQLRDLDVPSWAASDAEQYYIQALVPSRVALDLGYLLDPSLRRTLGLLSDTAMHVVRRGRSARPAKPAKPVLPTALRSDRVGRWQPAVLSDAVGLPEVESRVP
jgi:lipopolysaccharide/colanic/teichoic acid biosynthesis glycosyltransferase/O-antigen/teichoic acid export membrane protein